MGSSQSSESAPPLPSPVSPPAATFAEATPASQRTPENITGSVSEAIVARTGMDPTKQHKSLGDGKYRVATKDAERYFYESQPANQKSGAAANFQSNLSVGAEAERISASAKLIAEEVAKQGGTMITIDNNTPKDEIRRILSQTEGLDISARRRDELSQQWRFMLASDPIQYGMDAGFLAGCTLAAGSLHWKVNRHPVRLGCIWCAGFAVGMITFPLAMVAWEEYNMSRVLRNEKDMMKRQREEFYSSAAKAMPKP